MPPETASVSPVTQRDSSDAKNTATGAMSFCRPVPPERRPRDILLLEIAADDARSMCALSFDHARIDRVDPNFPRTQLLRQHAGHRVDRAFRGGVDDRIRRIEIARYGADIDDAATLDAKKLCSLPCCQPQAQHRE